MTDRTGGTGKDKGKKMKTSELIRKSYSGDVRPNKAQAKSLIRIARRHGDNIQSIIQMDYMDIIAVQVKNMFIGIERDGYAHTQTN